MKINSILWQKRIFQRDGKEKYIRKITEELDKVRIDKKRSDIRKWPRVSDAYNKKSILDLPEGWKEYEEENLDKELEDSEQSEVGKQSRVDEDNYGEKTSQNLKKNWIKSELTKTIRELWK